MFSKSKTKKSIISLLLLTMVLASSVNTFATEKNNIITSKVYVTENIGVGVNPPEYEVISTRGASKPDDEWDITSGQYDFSGSAIGIDLYTNYYFTGSDSYEIYVKNRHASSDLKVIVEKNGFWGTNIETFSVASGKSKTITLDSSDVSTSDNFHIKFLPSSNFSGYIK